MAAAAASRRPDAEARRRLTRRRLAAGACSVVAAWVSYAVYSEGAAGHAADLRVTELEQQNDAIHAQIAQRQRELAEAQTDGWLVEEARRRGYVRAGEHVYVPVAGGSPLPADGGIDPGPLPSFGASGASPGASSRPVPVFTPPPSTPSGPTPIAVGGQATSAPR